MPRKSTPCEDQELADLPEPVLTKDQLQAIGLAKELPPEEFQKALVPGLQVIVAEGLASVPVPRSWKELSTAIGIHSKLAGLDKDKGLGGPVGLVGVMRTVGRRVIEVPEVEDLSSFEV